VVIAVAMKLHNFCINKKAEGDSMRHWMLKCDFRAVYTDTVRWHKECRENNASETISGAAEVSGGGSRTVSQKRERLLSVIIEKGLRRPAIIES